jgi:hypothetical protein
VPDTAIIWEPVAGIDSPCAAIAFRYDPPDKLQARMYFSRVNGGPSQDLEVLFKGVIGIRWSDEFHGSIVYQAPQPAPKCRDSHWSRWVFPLLRVCESSWLATYQGLPATALREHFALISMNDLLDVIALPDVEAHWVPAEKLPTKG